MKSFYKEIELFTENKELANAYEKASDIVDIHLFDVKKKGKSYSIKATQDFYDFGHILLFENDLDLPLNVLQKVLLDNFGVAYTKEQLENNVACEWLKYRNGKALAIVHPKQYKWVLKDGKLERKELKDDARVNWLTIYNGSQLLALMKKRNFNTKQDIVDFIIKNMWACEVIEYKKSDLKGLE